MPRHIEGSLGKDGHRKRPYPADVSGRFVRARRVAYFLLIALWAALPWINVGGHPAIFLDVERRQFFLFGATANAQDFWLVFFGATGVGFALVYVTALLGRVWCGWACPQTVFLEAVFRPIERLVQGPRNVQMRRAQGPWTAERLARTLLTHALWILAAALVAHILLAYFVSLPKLFDMVRHDPGAHPEAFVWMLATTAIMYGNFAFFREQLCVVVCPYGRLQSVLIDDDSLVVGYDERRGEPRGKSKGKAKAEAKGDCVDCNRCVVVCPTGIDIRDGLQLDCIACTACIDACDEVMDKLERPRGLVRYDSLRGLRGEPKKVLRPRLYGYTVALVVGAVVAGVAVGHRASFEANVVRMAGPPYTREGDLIRNAFEIHLVNKGNARQTYELVPSGPPDLSFILPMAKVDVEPLGGRHVSFFVTANADKFVGDRSFSVRVRPVDASGAAAAEGSEVHARFLGASR